MDIFASIRQLLTITTSTDDRYSTVVYPTRGEAVLIHDGLGIANEYPWYHRLITQPNSSSNEINDCDWSKRNELDEDAFWGTGKCEDDSYWDYESEGSEINPASGLPMLGGVDVAGNPYGSGSFFSDPFPFSSSGF